MQPESESIELCVSDAIPEIDRRGRSLFQQAPQAVRPSGPEKRKSAASGIPNYDSVKFSLTFSPLQNSQSISLQDNNLKSLCKLLVWPPAISTTQTNSLRYILDHAKRPAGPWRIGGRSAESVTRVPRGPWGKTARLASTAHTLERCSGELVSWPRVGLPNYDCRCRFGGYPVAGEPCITTRNERSYR